MKKIHRPARSLPVESQLETLVAHLVDLAGSEPEDYERVLRRFPKSGGGFYSKSEIIQGFRRLQSERRWSLPERRFLDKLRMKPVRTVSGVAPVTVLTKPFPCPGHCIFCPSDVRMPKSYLASEPGAQRAAQHQFDPFAQTLSRLHTYYNIGHPIDKIELIVLGGTWSSYPEAYQIWFIKRCLDAMNQFAPPPDGVLPPIDNLPDGAGWWESIPPVDGRELQSTYNELVARATPTDRAETETSTWEELFAAQSLNERSRSRCVGLVVETRPDHLTSAEVERIRRLGATKVQLGYQSLSDDVLEVNKRGHGVAETRLAMKLLRNAGFKIHAHWMPNLAGSSVVLDLEDFDRIFADPSFRPDELKIYPCSLVETAELMSYYETGRWHPYSTEELLSLVQECILRTPRYCRITRVVRDIPGTDIVDGSRMTNLREVAVSGLAKRGLASQDIRSREIRDQKIDPERLQLRRLDYSTSSGTEVFLELVTDADRLTAFLRLSLPSSTVEIPEIGKSAMIREVHVYGRVAALGQRYSTRSQHLGLGTRLIDTAARIARQAGFSDLAVISSIGTRQYYRRLGFRDGELYQHRPLGGLNRSHSSGP